MTTNDDRMAAYVKDVVGEVLGPERYFEMPAPMMGAEDFSYFLNEVPGAFWFIGASGGQKDAAPIHSSHMVIDEPVLEIGARFAASVAAKYLHDQPLG